MKQNKNTIILTILITSILCCICYICICTGILVFDEHYSGCRHKGNSSKNYYQCTQNGDKDCNDYCHNYKSESTCNDAGDLCHYRPSFGEIIMNDITEELTKEGKMHGYCMLQDNNGNWYYDKGLIKTKCNERKNGYYCEKEDPKTTLKVQCQASSEEDRRSSQMTCKNILSNECTAVDVPFPGCDTSCTTNASTPYIGCTCKNRIEEPHGCKPLPCTVDDHHPYPGCDTSCTSDSDTPYTGCTCISPNIPSGCVPAALVVSPMVTTGAAGGTGMRASADSDDDDAAAVAAHTSRRAVETAVRLMTVAGRVDQDSSNMSMDEVSRMFEWSSRPTCFKNTDNQQLNLHTCILKAHEKEIYSCEPTEICKEDLNCSCLSGDAPSQALFEIGPWSPNENGIFKTETERNESTEKLKILATQFFKNQDKNQDKKLNMKELENNELSTLYFSNTDFINYLPGQDILIQEIERELEDENLEFVFEDVAQFSASVNSYISPNNLECNTGTIESQINSGKCKFDPPQFKNTSGLVNYIPRNIYKQYNTTGEEGILTGGELNNGYPKWLVEDLKEQICKKRLDCNKSEQIIIKNINYKKEKWEVNYIITNQTSAEANPTAEGTEITGVTGGLDVTVQEAYYDQIMTADTDHDGTLSPAEIAANSDTEALVEIVQDSICQSLGAECTDPSRITVDSILGSASSALSVPGVEA